MQSNPSNLHSSVSDTARLFKPTPFTLFIASVAIIFVAEALVMALIYFLKLPEGFSTGIVDASLLSLFVVPTLYFMFFKPMRETILRLDKSEEIQKQFKEIDQLKSEFISIASHELCTPITAIKGYTEMLLDQIDTEPHKEYLETIYRKAQSIERITDDLGIAYHLEADEPLQVLLEEHDLVATVNHLCKVYQMRFPEKPFNISLPQEPLVFMYDEIRISQVLDNLLSNAVKYSESIHDEIEVSVTKQDSQILLRVKDEGIGMSDDELKKVYNKFFRAQTEKSAVGGLGLGMAIVKNIVERHNGRIDIVSQKKVGTTVTVAFPKITGP